MNASAGRRCRDRRAPRYLRLDRLGGLAGFPMRHHPSLPCVTRARAVCRACGAPAVSPCAYRPVRANAAQEGRSASPGHETHERRPRPPNVAFEFDARLECVHRFVEFASLCAPRDRDTQWPPETLKGDADGHRCSLSSIALSRPCASLSALNLGRTRQARATGRRGRFPDMNEDGLLIVCDRR